MKPPFEQVQRSHGKQEDTADLRIIEETVPNNENSEAIKEAIKVAPFNKYIEDGVVNFKFQPDENELISLASNKEEVVSTINAEYENGLKEKYPDLESLNEEMQKFKELRDYLPVFKQEVAELQDELDENTKALNELVHDNDKFLEESQDIDSDSVERKLERLASPSAWDLRKDANIFFIGLDNLVHQVQSDLYLDHYIDSTSKNFKGIVQDGSSHNFSLPKIEVLKNTIVQAKAFSDEIKQRIEKDGKKAIVDLYSKVEPDSKEDRKKPEYAINLLREEYQKGTIFNFTDGEKVPLLSSSFKDIAKGMTEDKVEEKITASLEKQNKVKETSSENVKNSVDYTILKSEARENFGEMISPKEKLDSEKAMFDRNKEKQEERKVSFEKLVTTLLGEGYYELSDQIVFNNENQQFTFPKIQGMIDQLEYQIQEKESSIEAKLPILAEQEDEQNGIGNKFLKFFSKKNKETLQDKDVSLTNAAINEIKAGITKLEKQKSNLLERSSYIFPPEYLIGIDGAGFAASTTLGEAVEKTRVNLAKNDNEEFDLNKQYYIGRFDEAEKNVQTAKAAFLKSVKNFEMSIMG